MISQSVLKASGVFVKEIHEVNVLQVSSSLSCLRLILNYLHLRRVPIYECVPTCIFGCACVRAYIFESAEDYRNSRN